ncbi:MAG TPA: hypothetical protein VJ803_12995 [Gemmatimonadaceae bacterium]|nr:hypothetical protein [Gemmatimonadaceae bacterium]
MIARLALRSLAHRKRRSLFLLVGYGLGVGVMIVLLAIGEALLSQARDEKLVGGGAITVLPEGLDIEVMKTGGVGGLFFSIDRARFVYRQLLASPRLARDVAIVAPQIEGKLLYLRTGSRELAVRATGEIPSRSSALHSVPALAAGSWQDDEGDRRWMAPTSYELYTEIDRFHLPPAGLEHPESWGEWHYFNVLAGDRRRWTFISFIVGGDVRGGEWGGEVGVTVREQGARTRRFGARVDGAEVDFSTQDANVAIGDSRVTLEPDGRYLVRARVPEHGGRATATVELRVTPTPRAYFPGAALSECRSDVERCSFVSGYVVPALRGEATGRVCIGDSCERFHSAPAYHDHNWGVWRGVTWEWGATRAGQYTVLYGRVHEPDGAATARPLFLYLVDSLGFRAIFRPQQILYTDSREIVVGTRTIRVPGTALLADVRGADTLRLELTIEDAIGTDTRTTWLERGEPGSRRDLETPYFIQMKGTARLSGRIDGTPLAGEGSGFFETYR